MSSATSFIADMNALQKELDSLPGEAARLIGSLMELVEVQNGSIEALLVANRKLLDVIDVLKG
ncbi:hypothetical protein C7T35_15380 [Variovorax sp. WS11]|uniref:hypothetical protein n=1 Tax=Variovorax sp. WS11 TaxID=1105204 RepID=UPI000D0D057C|nr:hypothetical protein [Variovorax sp. WS11]NDZ12056.1 hypothetical protein [Variovorax sp. WS11]PSL83761.1 hypothetical protein C7T35_15380 [Variovorax sp. WS11]